MYRFVKHIYINEIAMVFFIYQFVPKTNFYLFAQNYFARKSTFFLRNRKFGTKLYLTVAKNENCNFLIAICEAEAILKVAIFFFTG